MKKEMRLDVKLPEGEHHEASDADDPQHSDDGRERLEHGLWLVFHDDQHLRDDDRESDPGLSAKPLTVPV